MKKFLVIMMAVLLAMPCAALAADNLLGNPDIESFNEQYMPSNWSKEMWHTLPGVSELSLADIGANGSAHSLMVENYSGNDARFVQTVDVEPNTCYLISCMIMVDGISEDTAGASIAIKDTFCHSDYLYDTYGQWQKVTLCGITGENQRKLTVMARIGDYGALAEGAAWFDNFTMERVENAVLDEYVQDFSTIEPSSDSDDAGGDSGIVTGIKDALFGSGQIALLLVLALMFAALAGLLYYYTERGAVMLQTGNDGGRMLIWLMALAFLMRLLIAYFVRGYNTDINCFEAWSHKLASGGLGGFYQKDYFCDYPPGYMYILAALGYIRNAFSIAYDTNLDWFIIKLPPMILDIVSAVVIYKLAQKRTGSTTALVLAAFCAFNPAAILNSAAWGQIDSVLSLLLILSIYWAMEDKWGLSLPAFGLAILMKPQALMFAPLGLMALVVHIVRAEDRTAAIKRALIQLGIMLAMMLLLFVPYIYSLDPALLAEIKGVPAWLKPIAFIFSLYGNTLSSYPHITINACNLYTLLDMNWVDLQDARTLSIIAWSAMGLSYLFTGWLFVRAKNVRKLPLIAALLLTLVFCFGAKMHERYLFPALALLLLAYIEDGDARIIIAFIALTFTQFMNAALVLRSLHLQSAEQVINAAISLLNILAAALLSWTGVELCTSGRTIGITRVYQHVDKDVLAQREAKQSKFGDGIFKARDHRMNLKPKDLLLIALMTAVYAALAFTNLGTTSAPQTTWTSSASGEQITIDLGEVRDFRLAYYGGISYVNFKVQISDDSEVWSKEYDAEYREGLCFRWLWYRPMVKDPNSDTGFSPAKREVDSDEGVSPAEKYELMTSRYIRLTMESGGLTLHELAIIDEHGTPLPIVSLRTSGGRQQTKGVVSTLFDEQDTVPEYPTHLNGTYFDEIYFARTGYEIARGLHNYEWTHPPLGKVLISVGIKLFGMTPFGWRFMDTLFGVLMVPLMYLLAKQIMKRTSLAFIASFLLAFDLMHFTQTRIATIDSFAVFFIMLMYLFMIRYAQMSFYHVKLWRTLVVLALCGITMGLAIASKWIGIYASVGLAAILLFTLIVRYREYRYVRAHMPDIDAGHKQRAQRISKQFWRNLIITLIWCLVFFIAVPAAIYYYSYYFQLVPDGNFSIDGVLNVQTSMLGYHAGLGGDQHYFRSPWYQWPVIAWPMWYYTGNDFMPDGFVSSITCMGNPAVFWVGLVAILLVLGQMVSVKRHDRRYIFVGIGFLSQYLPWILVPRSTFIYHYFASVPFIILAAALMLDQLRKYSQKAFKITAIALCAAAVILFAFFYPIASGLPIPESYARFMRWFNWVNY